MTEELIVKTLNLISIMFWSFLLGYYIGNGKIRFTIKRSD